MKFDSNQDKINLPVNETQSGVAAVASGWGLENARSPKITEKLKKVTLHTLSHHDCQLLASQNEISAHQICTYGALGMGVCVVSSAWFSDLERQQFHQLIQLFPVCSPIFQGDSGGPLAHNNTLIGIISYGAPCALGVPDIHTNVFHYLDWIKEKCSAA